MAAKLRMNVHSRQGNQKLAAAMKIRAKTTALAFAAAAIAALPLAGCDSAHGAHGMAGMPPPVVGVVTVEPQPVVVTSELPGRTSPYQVSEVRPQVSGIIKARLFTEGSNVRAGEPLYQIDPAPYKAAYDSQAAALAKAQANLATVRLKAQRYADLVKINAVSKQDYDDAVALAQQAEADVASAKAALETARINLGYTKVAAPISGRIGPSAVTAGALVTANQTTNLATLQTLDPIYVDVTQSSAELLRLKQQIALGGLDGAGADRAKVKLILEDGSTYPWEGELKVSDVTVDPSTGAVTLRAVFPNPKSVLLPGMFVRAVVNEAATQKAILAPQRGVSRDPQGHATAFVVNAAGKVEVRVLQAPRTVGDSWLVTSGLNPGDRLIVEGVQKVQPGMPVQVAPAAATPPKGGQG
jgi:membrane fusion protein (multidrug efflux system)